MKKIITKIVLAASVLIAVVCAFAGCGGSKDYNLTEATFFKVMYNMVYYPEQYLGANVSLDCFVYEIEDVKTGEQFVCGVRKCSSGIGCTCGNDTIIGFILDYNGVIPAARNQSEDSSDKTWIHISGSLVSAEKVWVNVYSYQDGEPTDNIEQINFYRFNVETLEEIDGTGLKYYVTN